MFFSEKEFKFIPEASGLLQATDADQLGDLGVMDLKMPVNGFLYVYVANESTQFVDFDHLTIIHQGGRVMEENHYYPYGMLMEGLSFSSAGAPNDYKFNGVQYETGNDLYNYLATFRNYDPAIAKWNQLDPMNQFYNGYFAYGGNPVSLADPLGLSVNYTRGGNGGSDAPTYQDRRDLWDKGMIGGGGFISASGGHYTFESLRAE